MPQEGPHWEEQTTERREKWGRMGSESPLRGPVLRGSDSWGSGPGLTSDCCVTLGHFLPVPLWASDSCSHLPPILPTQPPTPSLVPLWFLGDHASRNEQVHCSETPFPLVAVQGPEASSWCWAFRVNSQSLTQRGATAAQHYIWRRLREQEWCEMHYEHSQRRAIVFF